VKILNIKAQGFKRLTAIDITPGSPVVDVRGNNAEGKSSLLDAIKTVLGGKEATPVKPVRTGEDYAVIRVELGDGGPDLVVEKQIDEQGERLIVTTAEGAKFTNGQTTVDNLLGRMTFDPLAFSRLNAADQATELRRLVPLSVDLDALAAADKADTTARRDVNRDAKGIKARLDVIPIETGLPDEKPDLAALTATLASAAETNTAIDRERVDRERKAEMVAEKVARAKAQRDRAAELRKEADQLEYSADEVAGQASRDDEELAALPPLDTPVDTTAARAAIDEARALLDRFARKETRDELAAEFEAKRAIWTQHDEAIKARAAEREKALAEAEMPIEGLGLARLCDVVPGNESEDLIVTFNGEPFSQSSSAEQLRVSMRLAMAANPKLRIMLIKDGSLLDPKGLELVRDLAGDGDYQVWMESVGEGDGTGIIMEAGAVRGAPTPEPLAGPRRRKPKGEGDEAPAAGPEVKPGELVKGDAPARTEAAPAADAPPPPPRRKATAMREFVTKPAGNGDLFGGDKS